MFTGIIQALGKIVRFSDSRIEVELLEIFSGRFEEPFEEGESISVDGACLTLESFLKKGTSKVLRFFVSEETLRKTSLGDRFRKGVPVNLERALRLSDAMGGHLVYGHVDGTFEVFWASERVLGVSVSREVLRFLPPKSSVAVNGVSLTVAEVSGRTIYIHLIPETLKRTNIFLMREGDRVNIEVDPIARYLLWRGR